jgi:hypothetical protein
MSLATVAVELDLYDGTGTLLTTGEAVFTPTGNVTVNNGLQEIAAAPVTVALGTGVQSALIIPTDTPGSSPSGWGWQVAFPGVPGDLEAFTFFCPAGPVAFTAASGTPGVFTWTPTSSFAALPNGSGIQLSGGSLPAGVAGATTYYVTGATSTTFRVAATLGGSPLALTGSGSGTLAVVSCLLSGLTPAGSTVALSPFMFAPSGTPTAGQVPVATGTGQATTWGTVAGGGGGLVAITDGGTGQSTRQAALDALAGAQAAGKYLRSDGTHTSLTAIQDGDGAVMAAGGGRETVSAIGSVTTAATLNLANGNVFTVTLGGPNVTLTFTGATSGAACSLTAYLTQDGTGGRTVTWPGGVTWLTGSAPVVPAGIGAVSAYVFESLDGGTTWFGSSVTGPALPLSIAQGGTGAVTAPAALAALGGAPVKAWQFTPEAFGAARNGKILHDGAMTASSNVLTSATAGFTSADVTKYVLVWGALTAISQPAYLFGTITGFTNSTTVTLSVTATNTVSAVGVLYGTDDTAAIQSAVSAAVTYSLTGRGALGQVVLSEGIYCSGATATLGDGITTFGNSSIVLPAVSATSGVKAQVHVLGAGSSQLPHWTQPQPPQSGSIIAAMRTDGSLNTGSGPTSIIGGPVAGYGGGGGTFSNMHVKLAGFTVLVPMSAGAYAGPDLYGVGQATVDDVSYLPLAVVPTGTSWPSLSVYGSATYYPAYSFGLRMPASGNNAIADIGSFTSYFTQISLIGSEHCNWVSLKTLFSLYGVLSMTNTGGGNVSHGIAGQYWTCENVTYPAGSVASGYFALDGPIGITVARCDIEGQTQIVGDGAGLLYGEIGFNLIAAPGSYLASQYAAGGTGLKLKRLEAAAGPVASPQAPPASTFAWPNWYYRDAWITLSATAISAVLIDSTAQKGLAASPAAYSFFLPAGHSYTPTYTGTLTHTVSLI